MMLFMCNSFTAQPSWSAFRPGAVQKGKGKACYPAHADTLSQRLASLAIALSNTILVAFRAPRELVTARHVERLSLATAQNAT